MSKRTLGDDINSADLFFVERFSSTGTIGCVLSGARESKTAEMA